MNRRYETVRSTPTWSGGGILIKDQATYTKLCSKLADQYRQTGVINDALSGIAGVVTIVRGSQHIHRDQIRATMDMDEQGVVYMDSPDYVIINPRLNTVSGLKACAVYASETNQKEAFLRFFEDLCWNPNQHDFEGPLEGTQVTTHSTQGSG